MKSIVFEFILKNEMKEFKTVDLGYSISTINFQVCKDYDECSDTEAKCPADTVCVNRKVRTESAYHLHHLKSLPDVRSAIY